MSKPSLNIRLILSGIIEFLGIIGIVWGFALITPFLGFIVGGLGALWIARAIDPPSRKVEVPE